MSFTNNATRFLDTKRVAYRTHTYAYSDETHSATAVAEAIGKSAEAVFKSLVVLSNQPGEKPMLVVIPGPDTLDLKALARAVGVKKARMASHAQAEELTGLQTGGISPLALINKGFAIYLDDQAKRFDTIVISAGERGKQIELSVKDLVKLTRARFITLSR